MTGHGSSSAENENFHVLVEIRAVNNRFLKITVSGELDAEHQALIESRIRGNIARGSVNVRLQVQQLGQNSRFKINQAQLDYYQQNLDLSPDQLGSILQLPGVVTEIADELQTQKMWPVVEQAVNEALESFCQMRSDEGRAMLKDLLANCDVLSKKLIEIEKIAPRVAEGYAKRITERINRLLEDHEVEVTSADLVREVGIFAEKIDISEELVRLASHIDQFRAVADHKLSDGRKLDFLTQELLRETNTIGSKANDADIARLVVEMKSVIERIREMTQNIE